MSESGRPSADETHGPVVAGPRPRLTPSERWRVAAWSLAPTGLVALVLTPFALLGPATAGEVLGASIVYGGLLGLAAGFVAVDRTHARMCPRCGARNRRRAEECGACGYDLAARPRFACDERHTIHLEPGLCACGRRLQPLPTVRGIGREIVFMLKVGAWLLAFLVGVGVLLRFAGG